MIKSAALTSRCSGTIWTTQRAVAGAGGAAPRPEKHGLLQSLYSYVYEFSDAQVKNIVQMQLRAVLPLVLLPLVLLPPHLSQATRLSPICQRSYHVNPYACGPHTAGQELVLLMDCRDPRLYTHSAISCQARPSSRSRRSRCCESS